MNAPKLGFGTGPILGRIGLKDSLRALQRAHELGVRHFDTARSYGWGEAEGALGRFLQQKSRHDCTIVSKCGIVPVRRSRLLSTAKMVARTLRARLPGSASLLQRAASASLVQPARTYDVSILAGSLETSLRELRTDYLDVLLLHHFQPSIPGFDAVLSWFERVKQQGKIRRYGFCIGTDPIEGLEFLRAANALGDSVVQAPVSRSLLSLPSEWREVPVFAYSPFSFVAETGLELHTIVAKLSAGCRAEAVVCSMFNLRHIEENVASIRRMKTIQPHP